MSNSIMIPADVPLEFKEKNCYKNSINLKAGNVRIPYTPEQIQEVIKCRQNIHHFNSNYVKILSLDEGLVSFDSYPYQKDMLDSCINNRFNIFLLSRQLGKCVTGDTMIKLRNKKTGEIKEITIKQFYEEALASEKVS